MKRDNWRAGTVSDDSRVPQAALSPEEWANLATGDDTGDVFLGADGGSANLVMDWNRCIPILNRHGTAALCLYGTPEGFTHDDVELVREAMKSMSFRFNDAIAIKYSNLSLRIAALLPPPAP
jgi:hypothetical protein